MSQCTGNLPVTWEPPAPPSVTWLDIKITCEPSPAPVCYTATDHPRWARPQP
jgi:hypothetical protein